MTRGEQRTIHEFITIALQLRHLLNIVERDDDDFTPEEREELLAYRPLSDLCVDFAHTLRRRIWKEWDEQRKEERKRKRAAEKRKSQRHGRKSKKTR